MTIEARPWVMAFSHDDQMLAVASYEGIQLWELGSGTLQETLESSRLVASDMGEGEDLPYVHHLTFAPGQEMLAFTSGDGMLWTWDWGTDEVIQVAESLGSYPRFVFTPEGDGVAVVLDRRIVQFLALPGGGVRASLEGFAQPARQLSLSTEGDLLALESYNDRIVARDFNNGSPQWEFDTELGSFLAISPQGDRYVDTYRDMSSRTSFIRIWGLPNGDLQQEFTPPTFTLPTPDATTRRIEIGDYISHSPEPIQAVFSPDGNTLAIHTSQDVIHLVNAYDQTTLSAIEMSIYDAEGMALSPQNNMIAFGGEDAVIRVCEIPSGTLVQKLAGQAGGISSLKFSPDGRTLVSVAYDGIAVWSWEDGELLTMLEPSLPDAQESYISLADAVYSPDGRILAAGCRTRDVIWLWEVREGTRLTTLVGSDRYWGTSSLAFSPDGATLVQALNDGTIRIWGIP
jgi:WD40 repeat protein